MKIKIVIGIIIGVIILACIVVIPIVVLKPKNTTPAQIAPPTTPIITAAQVLKGTLYTGYIQDAANGQYLIFQIGQPITTTATKSQATLMTILKPTGPAALLYLFYGHQTANNLKVMFADAPPPKSFLSYVPVWINDTHTLSSEAATPAGWGIMITDIAGGSLVVLDGKNSALTKNMTFEEQGTPTQISTLQLV